MKADRAIFFRRFRRGSEAVLKENGPSEGKPLPSCALIYKRRKGSFRRLRDKHKKYEQISEKRIDENKKEGDMKRKKLKTVQFQMNLPFKWRSAAKDKELDETVENQKMSHDQKPDATAA
jgi:hypothetical protein